MTNVERMTNDEIRKSPAEKLKERQMMAPIGARSFGFRISSVTRHSTFVLSLVIVVCVFLFFFPFFLFIKQALLGPLDFGAQFSGRVRPHDHVVLFAEPRLPQVEEVVVEQLHPVFLSGLNARWNS